MKTTTILYLSGFLFVCSCTMNKSSQSGEKASKYSQQQLTEINDELTYRINNIKDKSALRSLIFTSVNENEIEIELVFNTPETQAAFRRNVMDSPAFRFTGITELVVNNSVGTNDTLGISLRPEYPVYSTFDKEAVFILYNLSGEEIECGEIYFITFLDNDGIWKELPINNFFDLPAYIVAPGKAKKFTARMYPDVFISRPGEYRFFYNVRIRGKEVQMMSEFQMTDNEQELKNAVKTAISKAE